MVKEREPFVVFRVSIDRIAVEQWRIFDQEGRRTVCLTVESFRLDGAATPVDPKIVDRRMPQIFAFCLPVTGCDQKAIDADLPQSLRQSSATSPRPPVLEYGTASAEITATLIELRPEKGKLKMENGSDLTSNSPFSIIHFQSYYVCIDARNSAFVFVFESRSRTTSICSTGERGFNTRRMTQIQRGFLCR